MPRKHITTACTSCRESKIKCDGAHPRCGNCTTRKKACLYKHGADKRKLSVRKTIEVFSRRVGQLEDLIKANGLVIPPPVEDDDALMLRRMADMLATSPGRRLSGDDRTGDSLCTTTTMMPPADLGGEQSGAPSGEIMPGAAPRDAFKDQAQTDAGLTPEPNSSSPDDTPYDVSHGNGAPPAAAPPAVDLDGMTDFSMDNVDFPDWSIDLSQTTTLPLDPAAYGWDQMHSPCPAYPNLDCGMPPPPPPPPPPLSPQMPAPVPLLPPMGTQIDAHGDGSGDESGDQGEDEEEDDVVNQVSDRMGALHLLEDGELRYYGATSNLTLLDDTAPLDHHRRDREADSARQRGQAMLEEAGLGHTPSPALVQHLTRLYFAWQNPSFHVVDRDMYELEQARYNRGCGDSTFYSETLMNTICAFGALYDARCRPDLPAPLSDFFLQRAKIWLDVELDSPRVATVQALAVLSSLEAARTRDARGWLYSGMSMRLSFDLGLHMDMAPYIARGRVSAQEAAVRKVAFWGSFVVDQLWGFYLGRPPFHINTAEVQVQKPAERCVSYATKTTEWVPYGLCQAAAPIHALRDPIELVSRQWVLLCEVMGSFCHVLYDRHDVDNKSLQAFVQSTIARLEGWQHDLPPELQVDRDQEGKLYLPHVLVLHMKYYQSLIYIYRPFISRQGARSFAPSPDRDYYLHARRVCIDSAVAVSTLLRIYRSTCTLRYANVDMVSIIFSVSIILVFASVASPLADPEHSGHDAPGGASKSRTSIASHLDTCCKALAELGHVFQNAARTLEMLLAIKRKWQAELLAATGSKRRGPTMTRPAVGRKKRTLSRRSEDEVSVSANSR